MFIACRVPSVPAEWINRPRANLIGFRRPFMQNRQEQICSDFGAPSYRIVRNEMAKLKYGSHMTLRTQSSTDIDANICLFTWTTTWTSELNKYRYMVTFRQNTAKNSNIHDLHIRIKQALEHSGEAHVDQHTYTFRERSSYRKPGRNLFAHTVRVWCL